MKLTLLLLFLSYLALQARADIGGSVVFFDCEGHKFIRSNSEDKALSTNEVAAAISVLLGSAPVSVSADSSLKLNEVLFPNPFDRPHAVFALEVTGTKDPLLVSNNKVGNTFRIIIQGSNKADIELSDEVGVSYIDEPLSLECDDSCIAQELAYLGGQTSASVDGELSFSLATGSSLKLHLSKKSDRSFALNLVSLTRNIKKALKVHEVLAESIIRPAELLIGRFTGIEALQEEYGSGDIVHQGLAVLQTALTKSVELLQKSYEGKIVGVILSGNSEPMLNVHSSTREPRSLAALTPPEIIIAEVILVRKTLAWITGILFLLSTLIGIYYLLYMPLTRDTLLYSNVKLD